MPNATLDGRVAQPMTAKSRNHTYCTYHHCENPPPTTHKYHAWTALSALRCPNPCRVRKRHSNSAGVLQIDRIAQQATRLSISDDLTCALHPTTCKTRQPDRQTKQVLQTHNTIRSTHGRWSQLAGLQYPRPLQMACTTQLTPAVHETNIRRQLYQASHRMPSVLKKNAFC